MGRIRGRKRIRLGPLVLNFSSAGLGGWALRSWGIKVWRWSWNSSTERHSIDVPGPWAWTSDRPKRED
ncbi:DUF4236 domain-containing protein [Pseudonocardia sp. Ae505_Ps2]|uniref:DUF4236 domain-containing protein n=1 Tax=Pseudonocardia sp. Ae505_Ps2 TaxID=1885034 RepID=UPI00094E338C|nr:DUF4236 domain-containing protein [Pseudonocardia sp. Ae505_Ps2]